MGSIQQVDMARGCRTSAGARSASKRSWFAPARLIALSLVPLGQGAARLGQLARRVAVNADNARFIASPLPVALHIVGATLFCVLGALQFAPASRRLRWHRAAGRVVLPSGLVAA